MATIFLRSFVECSKSIQVVRSAGACYSWHLKEVNRVLNSRRSFWSGSRNETGTRILDNTKDNSTLVPSSWSLTNKRYLWGWLNAIFNKVDESRIKDVGPDRACAEWLLRCGALVKWQNRDSWTKDYNTLPQTGGRALKIQEIDATDAAIMHIGFPHFIVCHLRPGFYPTAGTSTPTTLRLVYSGHHCRLLLTFLLGPVSVDLLHDGCKHIRRIVFHKANYLEDAGMALLPLLQDSLKKLQVSSCGNVTADGLRHIKKLKNLEYLLLFDLPEIRDKEAMQKELQDALPNCAVVFPYAQPEDDPNIKQNESKE